MPRKNSSIKKLALVLILIMAGTNVSLFARAGGGGARSSRSSSSSSLGTRSSATWGQGSSFPTWILFSSLGNPSFLGLGGIALVVVLVFMLSMRSKKGGMIQEFKEMNGAKPLDPQKITLAKALDPAFEPEELEIKTRGAFLAIQEAWSQQNLAKVRPYLSDGMWQRFHTQFSMMEELQQKNLVGKIVIHQCKLHSIEIEGRHLIAQVMIEASAQDSFVSKLDRSLNQSSEEKFVEFWTLVKKIDPSKKFANLYEGTQCPSCGASLPEDLGELAQCAYCRAVVNAPHWDWILCQIREARDEALQQTLERSPGAKKIIEELSKGDDSFCSALVLDTASNAWFQIQRSIAQGRPEIMFRFTDDEAFNTLSDKIQEPFSYNRIYLEQGIIKDARVVDEEIHLEILLHGVKQKVRKDYRDPLPLSRVESMTIKRALRPGTSKGKLYMHQCTSCGGILEDSLRPDCPYCGQGIRNPAHDWLITKLNDNHGPIDTTVSPPHSSLRELLSVRDYALNNVLALAKADGSLSAEEESFVRNLAKELGYTRKDEQESILSIARQRRLAVRMPDDPKLRIKIYKLMEACSHIDQRIDVAEASLLRYVRKEFLNSHE